MYQFTNEQRRCFGLEPVLPGWKLIQLKTSHYDTHDAYAYVDGCTIRKCIFISDVQYWEYDYDEQLSEDLTMLLPKTSRGKAVRLSSATMMKRTNRGMAFSYYNRNGQAFIDNWCADNQLCYYKNYFERLDMESFDDFIAWVERWCDDTTEEDIREIEAIKQKKRAHIKCREGDVFRFKLTRRLYGYGRIIRDYTRLDKEKIPYFRTFLGTAVLCSAYLIITEDKNVPIDELRSLKSMPSMRLNEAIIYHGEYEIIGNIPITDDEDYPFAYSKSIDFRERHLKKICFQNGRDLLTLEGADPVPEIDRISGDGSCDSFKWMKLDILRKCIEEDSVAPYWDDPDGTYRSASDLRNPKNAAVLCAIRKQFGLIE